MVRWGAVVAGILPLLAAMEVAAADRLEGSEWRPIELYGQPLRDAGADSPFVRFESGGRVVGFAGCNNFFGDYSQEEDRLSLGAMGATRKMCDEPAMSVEDTLFAAFAEARMVLRDRTLLHVGDETGTVIARFRQTDFD